MKNQWPPNQPSTIVNVALIHHEGEQTQQELIDMSMRNVSAIEKLSSHHPRVTKRIADIFRSSHKRILIEGAPGIGKTVLAKEIAYCWANGEILDSKKLFLVFIRNPDLHRVKSINELVYYLGNNYLNDSEITVVADEIKKTKGSGIVFVIDGYDECPCDRPLSVFIDELCYGDILSQCILVITSRPTASLSLRRLVNQRIEILGLAKKERDQYISESLKESPKMKSKLLRYLKQQPVINSLSCVPLHLAVLLYLFKQDSLPESLTEMNELFVVHTIYRCLVRVKRCLISKFRKLIDLPVDVFDVIKQMSKLAFKGLCRNQLVFTGDEIKEVCPIIDNIKGAINGFDLLQAVQHYCQKGAAGIDISFVFLHFTMQEFLAAFYITTLPTNQQSVWIKRTFWDSQFSFMWIMYVGIVGVKSECVTEVIQYFDVNRNYQYNIKKYLHLFQCYLEAKDCNNNEIPQMLSSIFHDGCVDFYGMTSLLPNHVTSLTNYMIKASIKWKSINLRACNIRDDGMRILQHFLINFQYKANSIKQVCLSGNNLTSFFGSESAVNDDQELQKEPETVVMCKFELMDLSNNQLSYSGITELSIVNVEKLDISHNNICDHKARAIGECLQKNNTIHELNLSGNTITNEGTIAIFKAILVNTVLQKINIADNYISDDGTEVISSCFNNNKTLLELDISKNLLGKEGVMRIVKACTKNRTLHKLMCTHNNLSKSGLTAINEYIRKENAVQIFDASWNSLSSKDNQQAIKITFEQVNTTNNDTFNMFHEEIVLLSEISHKNSNYKDQITDSCLEERMTSKGLAIQKVYLVDSIIHLILLNWFNSLDISGNSFVDKSIGKIVEAFQAQNTLQQINISSNKITDEGAKRLAEAIETNTTLQELNISKNWISKEGLMRIVEACTKNRALRKLVCTHNNLSKSGLAAINEYIRKKSLTIIFDASWNNLGNKDNRLAVHTIFHKYNQERLYELWAFDEITEEKQKMKFLQCSVEEHFNTQTFDLSNMKISNFQVEFIKYCLALDNKVNRLNLSGNEITIEKAKDIVEIIQANMILQNVDISYNAMSDDGIFEISNCLKSNSTVCILILLSNKITDKGAKRLSEAIRINKTLQELNISKNQISQEGIMRIVKACTINRTLRKLVCTHNNLSKSGLAAINEYIRKENAVQIFDASWNSVIASKKCGFQLVITTLQSLRWSPDGWENNLLDNDIQMWFVNNMIWNRIPCRFMHDSPAQLEFLHHCILPKDNNAQVDIIQGIMKINTLQELNVFSNEILDDGAIAFSECLETNLTLIELNIKGNNITYKGANRLAKAIQVNNALQELNISCNKISDNGAIAFGECLKTNRTLIELNMGCNNITSEGASGLAKAIQVNTALEKLNISGNQISDDGAIAFGKCLETNSTLIELKIKKNNISYNGADRLAEALQVNTALQKLNISNNKISDDGAIAFGKCLETNSTLIELKIKKNNITYNGADRLAEALQVNTALEKLNISGNQISDDGAIAFSECLKTNLTLIELKIKGNNITYKGANRLAEALQENTALQKLNISNNKISDDGAIAFDECLKTNTTLIKLNMEGSNIKCKEASRLAEAIQVNSTLQKLNISDNQISDDGAAAFCECLKTNTTLIELEIKGNNITYNGANRLAEAIQGNTALQKLDISNNQLSDDGAIAFSECLKTNTTLIELDMERSNITCKGAVRLAEAIQVNITLQKLNISDNQISDDGVIAFSECLKTNEALIELDVWKNYITCTGANRLAEAFQINTALQRIYISDIQVSDDGAIDFGEFLRIDW